MEWLRTAWATARRNQIVMWRAYPWSFTASVGLGALSHLLIGFLLWRYLFKQQVSAAFVAFTGTRDYLSYLLLGAVSFQFTCRTVLNVSRSLVTELREGTLEVLLLSPAGRWPYLAGGMAAQLLPTCLEVLILVAVGVLLGVRFNAAWGSGLVSVVATLYGLFGMSVLVGVAMLWTGDTFIMQNTLSQVIFLTSGVMFPPEYLPAPVQVLGRFLPTTQALHLIRGTLLLGRTCRDQLPVLLELLGWGTAYLVIAALALRRVERRVLATRPS